MSVGYKIYVLKVPWPRAKVADSKNRKECYHNYFTTKLSQRLINTLEVSAAHQLGAPLQFQFQTNKQNKINYHTMEKGKQAYSNPYMREFMGD